MSVTHTWFTSVSLLSTNKFEYLLLFIAKVVLLKLLGTFANKPLALASSMNLSRPMQGAIK